MASVARGLFNTLFLCNNLIFNLIAGVRYPPINPKRIEISDHWEKDGISYQEKHINELIVKRGASGLRLVCKIDPPLPKTEEHFELRDHLVRFEKIYPEHYVLTGPRYWSDSQQIMAVALDIGVVDLFGTYVCVYGEMRKTVNILAENEKLVKDLPAPVTLENMMSSTFIKKYFVDNVLNNNSFHPEVTEKTGFHCEVKISGLMKNSVHRLTPTDISVVASLGDSVMIGLGAKGTTMVDFFTEYRGISWSNGGDADFQDVLTLPNILKRFNSKLKGYSTNIARHYEKNSGLNFATVSATSRDLQEQVHQLISKVKQDQSIDFKKDWKLVNVMSGTRDLCRLCGDMDEVTPDDYITSLVKTLDTLQTKMPRTFVNLILPLNVSSLYALNNRGHCTMGNWSICPCLGDEFMRKKISNFYQGYKTLVYELIDSGVYDTSEDFTVVVQPVFEDLSFDIQDRDLFSLDCLHFSVKGNALAAITLWNNMFEQVNKKSSRWHRPQKIKCPVEDSPHLSTRINSKTEVNSERTQDSKHGMAPAIIVTVTLAIIFTLALIVAFAYLKHRLRTPITKLKFSNKPWLKYSI